MAHASSSPPVLSKLRMFARVLVNDVQRVQPVDVDQQVQETVAPSIPSPNVAERFEGPQHVMAGQPLRTCRQSLIEVLSSRFVPPRSRNQRCPDDSSAKFSVDVSCIERLISSIAIPKLRPVRDAKRPSDRRSPCSRRALQPPNSAERPSSLPGILRLSNARSLPHENYSRYRQRTNGCRSQRLSAWPSCLV